MLSRLVPRKFGTRLFAITLAAGLVPTVVYLLLIHTFEGRISSQTRNLLAQGEAEFSTQADLQLRTMAERQIQLRAEDVAGQIERYLRLHPGTKIQELQQDPVFRLVAVQRVGETGYTAVQDSDRGINRLHQNPRFQDLDLRTLSDRLPEFWKIMEESLGGRAAWGYYQWQEPDGTLQDKFMYIAPVLQTTADGVSLGVAATTYVSEFFEPLLSAREVRHQTIGRINTTIDEILRSSVRAGLLFMVLGIALVSILAYLAGVYFSRAIAALREATLAVDRGDFSVRLEPVVSGELGELTRDVNHMVIRLGATTVSKESLEKSERLLKKANLILKTQVEKRIAAEAVLKEHRDQLAERTTALEAANRELQDLDRMKDSFLSSVSHEFRTPLTAIQSFVDILLTYPEEEFETKREFLTIIRGETERLTRLINNLLDLSRIRAGRMEYHFRSIRLEPLVENAVKTLWGLFGRKDLRVIREIDPALPEFPADADRLFQVLTNLLSNSIKFTPKGGEIRVRGELQQTGEADLIHISVRDTGAGIKPHLLPHVFDLFVRGTEITEDTSRGTGLGLSICREIVSSHQGVIWAESEYGKGSTFHIHLPVARRSEALVR